MGFFRETTHGKATNIFEFITWLCGKRTSDMRLREKVRDKWQEEQQKGSPPNLPHDHFGG